MEATPDVINSHMASYLKHSLLGQIKLLSLLNLAKSISNLPGDLAEVGVFRGGTGLMLAELYPHKTIHLFDTFTGMSEDDLFPEGFRKGMVNDTSLAKVIDLVHTCPNVRIHAGVFPETAKVLPDEITFSFVHLDCDIYQCTKAGVDYFYPRLNNGGILLFDDWMWPHCPGIKKVVSDAFSAQDIHQLTEFQVYVIK